MAILIFLICAFLWYFPLYKKQGKTDRMPGKFLIFAILAGAIPAFIAIVALQIPIGWGLNALKLSPAAHDFLDAFVSAALVEELIKFLCGYIILRIARPRRCIDCILLFGGVGLGYEITESLMTLDSTITGLVRGVFAYHIVWQFWMGLFYWRFMQAEKGKRFGPALAAFGVPMLLHGLNDFICFMFSNVCVPVFAEEALSAAQEKAVTIWLLAFLGFIVVSIVFAIITMKKCFREAKLSREADVKA